MSRTNLGNFYQGQLMNIIITNTDDNTEEERAALAEQELYLGIYKLNKQVALYSTKEGTLTRTTSGSGATMTVQISVSIEPTVTKSWIGEYTIELLMKNADNTMCSPCKNIIHFNIERRILSSVIG